MLCFRSRPNNDDRRSREIDSLLRREEKAMKKVIKLLLLGAGESGKSTILKQMRLIYTKEGFTKQEKEEWRGIIFNNILDGLRITINAMQEFNFEFQNTATLQYLPVIKQACDIEPEDLNSMKHLAVFKSVWSDPGFQKAVNSGKFALHDNLQYFFSDLDRLFNKDFVPTNQDILQARLRTTGITETVFDLGTFKYRMFDVGGQRSERKKWIHCFENVNALIFLVAISGYDQCLAEDREGNQMQEALMLWESIANSHWFKKSALILFLNKIDLFRSKVAHSPITKYGFTDFRGDTKDASLTSKYFMDKFTSLSRSPSQEVYPHFTNATDTDLLKVTMASVQDMIIQKNLQRLIL
ncbi:Guanine nucleotide-binding protein alpha-2 subunit [Erysiphe necator]|uniref:Putative g protein alpha subunit n=1 Tax=Uncinula necator TaxID=52586 RepID=A0A0B1P5X4_UNCNE|nr:Guanine nucleotide-binding protein alpha-2 subunit [Erysiphe necator]KHJ32084.1 putative g protein alpha subunit [Erysiphe necator]